MGVSPFLQAETLNLLVSQRLVRLLCPSCKRQYEHRQGITLYRKTGCAECYYTGYKGRKAIYEVIPVDQAIAESIRQGQISNMDIRRGGLTTLADSALNLLREGRTSLEEVISFIDKEEI